MEDDEKKKEPEAAELEHDRLAYEVAGKDHGRRPEPYEQHRDDLQRDHTSTSACSRCRSTRAVSCVSTPFKKKSGKAPKSAFRVGSCAPSSTTTAAVTRNGATAVVAPA